MEKNNVLLQMILGVIVLIPPIWTILKNYYDKFRIGVISEEIKMGIHEWDGDRFEIRFFIPMEIANFSNSMGCITDMRLKLKYQIKGLIWYSEYLSADYELISKEDKKFDFRKRGNSLLSIVKNETLAFMLKPQEGCKKHVLFRTFWNKLKLVDDFQVILEIQLNNKKWKAYKKWRGHLCQTDYDLYICGGGVIPMTVEKNERWIIRKWHQYMLHKIKTKYDAEVNMKKIVVSPSVSKW